ARHSQHTPDTTRSLSSLLFLCLWRSGKPAEELVCVVCMELVCVCVELVCVCVCVCGAGVCVCYVMCDSIVHDVELVCMVWCCVVLCCAVLCCVVLCGVVWCWCGILYRQCVW